MRRYGLVVGLILALSSCSSVDQHPQEAAAPSSTTTSAGLYDVRNPAKVSDVVGRWRPVKLFGEQADWRSVTGKPLSVSFKADGATGVGWSADDGCNDTGGTAYLSQGRWTQHDGAFSTLVGCVPSMRPGQKPARWSATPENVDAILQASYVELQGSRLAFVDATGDMIGLYERAPAKTGS